MGAYPPQLLRRIFNKGTIIRGKNPSFYRKDKFGSMIYWSSYGKITEMGWEVDHSKPQSKGGTNHLNNLQPMHWHNNRSKGDSYYR